jgi:hypothetical protein
MKLRPGLTRRQHLAASGAAALAAGFGLARPAAAQETIRQGYQTSMWGMPTYYLLGRGPEAWYQIREFAVPSGNLTMQQMVARRSTSAPTPPRPSFSPRQGGLVGIAVIEHVGKTTRVMARKELN